MRRRHLLGRLLAATLRGPARSRGARIALGVALVLGALLCPRVRSAAAPAASAAPYTGWAMDAYPGDRVSTLKAEMTRQVAAGANMVWLGHNNPGEVDAAKGEPALSYAVWTAYMNPSDPKHLDAAAMVQAQLNALQAARQLGVRVVFPIGYQIQMGQAWNAAHPQDLRRDAKGAVYEHGGKSAAFQSPEYQRDILAYYHWVDSTIVRPNAGTIMMINLGDEPADGDYSVWADRVFQARYGYGLRDAGQDPTRQEAVGRFEADYIADYEEWSAAQWESIDPAVKVTMSFCGGYGRYQHEGPDLEAVFREAPANFVVTFDAYPRDGLYSTPLREGDLISLFALVRTLGYYSAQYLRPLWLWSTANSWGLNGASKDPGNIADAVANGIYLAQLAMQGGALAGIAVWNYNIKGQGLLNDTHALTYDPSQMFTRVSASFSLLRSIMAGSAGQPDTVVLAPNEPALQAAGATLALRADDGYSWTSLAALARDNVAAPVLTHLDSANLSALRTAIVLAPTLEDLTLGDRRALLTLLSKGGTIMAAASVAKALHATPSTSRMLANSPTGLLAIRAIATPVGRLLGVDGGPVESVFSDGNAAWASPALSQSLHWTIERGGYLISVGDATLLYSGTASPGALMVVNQRALEQKGTLTLVNQSGAPDQTKAIAANGRTTAVWAPRRTYGLLIGQ
ncbi:MAG TPA: hypothetical protein VNL71_09180 [Chloroflexota bacterium]|nr:hypothetical protein [Chloroflexota bacterium]